MNRLELMARGGSRPISGDVGRSSMPVDVSRVNRWQVEQMSRHVRPRSCSQESPRLVICCLP